MYAGTGLRPRMITETRSVDATRIQFMKTASPDRHKPTAKPFTSDVLIHHPIMLWTGPGGCRAPDWPLAALCPGANWN